MSENQDPSPGGGVNINADGDFVVVGDVAGRDVIVAPLPPPKDRHSLRIWWHELLREHGRYSCYAVFLALPSDILV